MRFAIAGTDRYLGVARAFCEAGWTPIKLFASDVDGRLDKNKAIVEWAQAAKLSVQLSRVQKEDLRQLQDEGCEALVVASYAWRIPEWRDNLRYAVNFHPSPLPEARGPDPTVRAILEERTSWAITCHKIDQEFDTGEILSAESFELASDDDGEVLDLKLQMAGARLAKRVAADFTALWRGARAQGPGSYWPRWTRNERELNFGEPVERLLRQVKAFGEIGCFAQVNKVGLFVKRASGWVEAHDYPPGTMVHEHDLRFVVAAQDGYIVINEWTLFEGGSKTARLAP
ncbi:MAG TPA: formyltransferase family protein [Polyangiaceae bacterium]|jgi:methionyl-tRNA formyltransferase|nr:formyltransferase family protein [Polyangiaceae bacterium]